jgi:hypothetical protein
MDQHSIKVVAQEASSLRFVYKERLSWEFRCEQQGQDGEQRFSLQIHLPIEGMGDVHQTFWIQREAVFQIVMWLARSMGVTVGAADDADGR